MSKIDEIEELKYKCPNCSKIDYATIYDMGYHCNIFCRYCDFQLNCVDPINPKPVVDEQKKRFAEHIVDWSELHPDTDEVQEAVKYLESLEAE